MWLSSKAKNDLNIHKKSVHEGLKYLCKICGHKATQQANLLQHIKSKHKGNKYQCNSCDKEYDSPSSLHFHIKSVHEGVTYECDICQYKAARKDHLTTHIKTVHLKEKKYKCKICDYQASHKNNLSSHVNIHQKIENINCTECNKSIKKTGLKKHMKLLHSGEQQKIFLASKYLRGVYVWLWLIDWQLC